MTVWQAVLIGLYHYVINCKYFILTQGQFVLGRPLISGLAVGIIMGRPVEGLIIGANINLVYLGWMDVGGMRATDPAVAGTLGTALALASNASPEEAIVLGSILGVVANFGYTLWMSVNSLFVPQMEKCALKANWAGMNFWYIVPSQVIFYLLNGLTITLACLLGAEPVAAVLENLPEWITNGFNAVAVTLPAVGICLNLKSIMNKYTVSFFILGFICAIYFNMNMIVLAILATIVAVIAIFGVGIPSRKGENE